MLVLSHYRIGSLVYRFIISKYIPFSPINRTLFKIGNVLPDFSKKLSKLGHSFEGSSEPYENFIKKAQDTSLSSGERMISLGALCHYLADFFCTYHAKEPFKNHSISRHLFYEFRLHLTFLTMLPFINKYIKQVLTEGICTIGFINMEGFTQTENKNKSALQILYNSMQNEYHSQRPAIKTDIVFAIKATMFSTELLMKEYPMNAPARLVFDAMVHSYIGNDAL